MPYTTVFDCPHCNSAGLEWNTENWNDDDGTELRKGVVCKECGAEIDLTYELVDAELLCLPDGTVVDA